MFKLWDIVDIADMASNEGLAYLILDYTDSSSIDRESSRDAAKVADLWDDIGPKLEEMRTILRRYNKDI